MIEPLHLPAVLSASGARPAAGQDRERDLIDRLRRDDYEAFDAIFTAYADALCAYAYHLLRSADDAEEIVQDLFCWVWAHRAEWEVPGELRTFLYRAVRNRAISTVRHRQVRDLFRQRAGTHPEDAGLSLGSAGRDATQLVCDAELRAAVDRAVAALPERCRQAFILSREHGLTYEEIAEVMKVSPKTVERHMARAFTGFREALAAWRG